MSRLEIELRCRHCGGCRQTVNLDHVGGDEARCPVCGRGFRIESPESRLTGVPARGRPVRQAA